MKEELDNYIPKRIRIDMENQLVSFKAAKLLKQIGFSYECERHYTEVDNWLSMSIYKANHNRYKDIYSAPSQELAKKFLREEYNIHIEVWRSAGGWGWNLDKADNGTGMGDSGDEGPNDSGTWDEYEDALNDGIEKACTIIIDKK